MLGLGLLCGQTLLFELLCLLRKLELLLLCDGGLLLGLRLKLLTDDGIRLRVGLRLAELALLVCLKS